MWAVLRFVSLTNIVFNLYYNIALAIFRMNSSAIRAIAQQARADNMRWQFKLMNDNEKWIPFSLRAPSRIEASLFQDDERTASATIRGNTVYILTINQLGNLSTCQQVEIRIVTVHKRAQKHILIGFSLKMSQMMMMSKSQFLFHSHFQVPKKTTNTGMYACTQRERDKIIKVSQYK